MTVRKGNKVIAGGNVVSIDSALNPSSPNPVQNAVITAALVNIDCGTMS